MAGIYVYEHDCTNFTTTGLVGVLNPLECYFEEEKNGSSGLSITMHYDKDDRWKALKVGNIIKAEVPVRVPPVLANGEYLDTVDISYVNHLDLQQFAIKMDLQKHADTQYTEVYGDQETTYIIHIMPYTGTGGQQYMLYMYSDGRQVSKIVGDKEKGTGTNGYTRKPVIKTDEQPIPQRFSGLEAVLIPTRMRDQFFVIDSVIEGDESVEVTASHIWYQLLKNYTTYKSQENQTVSGYSACKNIMSNTLSPVSHFYVESDVSATQKDLDYNQKNIVEAFLDPKTGVCAKYNAVLLRDNWDFYVISEANVGYDRGFVVEYGQNLLEIERSESIENVATRVIPYGKDSKGNPVYMTGTKWVDSENIDDYPNIMVELLDCSKTCTIGKDGTTEQNITEKLRAEAQKRFDDDKIDIPEVEMTVNFLSLGDSEEYAQYRGLDKVYLYDKITIKDKKRGYNYSAEVTYVKHNVMTGMLEEVRIGKIGNSDGVRTIATWQVPQVSGENIRLKSIQLGSFADGAVDEDAIANGAISTVHLASATIDDLTTESLSAVQAQIEDLIAGHVTAEAIVAGAITTEKLDANAVTTEKLDAGAVTAEVIASGAITTEKLDANAVTAEKIQAQAITSAKIDAGAITSDKIATGAITSNKIDAEAITTDKIATGAITADSAIIAQGAISDAQINSAGINYAKIKDLNASSAYFGDAIFEEAIGGKIYVPRLLFNTAQGRQMLVEDLIIGASNGNYYALDITETDGVISMSPTQVTVTSSEIEQGHSTDGRAIIGTTATYDDLATSNLYAIDALIDTINAKRIDVDELWARQAFINKLQVQDLSSNTYIQATVGSWSATHTNTLTDEIAGINRTIGQLGRGQIFYSETEPENPAIGDLWIQPQLMTTWASVGQFTWAEIEAYKWLELGIPPKQFVYTGDGWETVNDSSMYTVLQTQLTQTEERINLKASQADLTLLGERVNEAEAQIDIAADRITQEVTARQSGDATAEANAKAASIAKTTQYQTASDIVTVAESYADSKDATTLNTAKAYAQDVADTAEANAKGASILRTEQYTSAAAIVNVAEAYTDTKASTAETNAKNASIARTASYQTATDIVNEAKTYVDGELTNYSTITQTSTAITTEVKKVPTTFRQNTQPTSTSTHTLVAGDLWIDTSNGNQLKRYNGSSWVNSSYNDTSKLSASWTGTYQSADALVNTANTYTDGRLGSYSTITQTSSAITAEVTKISNGTTAVGKLNNSKVTIDTNGINLKTSGVFTVASGNFAIDSSGNVTVKGNVQASSGSVGGWTIGSDWLGNGSSFLGSTVGMRSTTGDNVAIWAGHTSGQQLLPTTSKFSVTANGYLKSTSGDIGGWSIGSNSLSSGSGTSYVALSTTGDYAMWAGNATASSAPFRVKRDGTVYSSKFVIVNEQGTESTVDLRNYALWKLNYKTIKSVDASTGVVTLSDNSTFRSAASVTLTGSWSGGTYTVTASNGATKTTNIRSVIQGEKDTSKVVVYEVNGSSIFEQSVSTVYQAGVTDGEAGAGFTKHDSTVYTITSSTYSNVTHFIQQGSGFSSIGTGFYKIASAADTWYTKEN